MSSCVLIVIFKNIFCVIFHYINVPQCIHSSIDKPAILLYMNFVGHRYTFSWEHRFKISLQST